MMEISVHDLGNTEKELEIVVPWEVVRSDYDDLLAQYARLPMKGFRPGKTPLAAIESLFRNQLKNDLFSQCSTRLCRKALKTQQLEAGSPIEISNTEIIKDKQIAFKARFIEMPQFELPDYTRLQLKSQNFEEKLDEVSLALLERTPMLPHPSLTEREMDYSDDGDAPEEQRRHAAEQRVKLMMILKKIASQDSIEVDDKDIDNRIRRVARENELTPQQLKEYLLSSGGLSRIADSLLAEQVLSYIIDIQRDEA